MSGSRASPSQRIHLVLAVFMVLLASFALLGLIELGLRVAAPDRLTEQEYVFHPRYLFALNPNTTHTFTRLAINGGQRITYRINQYGFRGSGDPRRGQVVRIMVYGDSNIQASFSALDHTFSKQLERRLRAEQPQGVEVLNMGVNGYSPAQYALKIEDELTSWKPDLIIVQLFADNDFGDLFRNKLFRLANDGSIFLNERAIKLHEEALGRSKLPDWLGWLERTMLYRSVLLVGHSFEPHPKYPKNIEEYLALCESEYQSYRSTDRPRLVPVHYDWDLALDPGLESSRTKLQLMDKVIRRIAEAIKGSPTKLLFVVQPSRMDVSADSPTRRADVMTKYPLYRRENLTDNFVEMIGKLPGYGDSISSVNLFPRFVREGENELYFAGNDNHWNDEGQATAARIVARHIVERGMLGAD